ncbi:NADH-quinone oxidoreductase subunit L [Myxococcota bacterium]|nr:NADH-quinone oxidoreductase subunit L [Myxococcota bacterium]
MHNEVVALTQVTNFSWLWLIPVMPLVGAFINGMFGMQLMKKFGPNINHIIAIIMPSISFVVTVIAFIKLAGLDEHSRVLYNNLFPFIHVGLLDADMAFWFDPLSAVMTLMITFVGTAIHIYSIGYMKGDDSYWRFFAYLNLFMASMLMLILGDNFLVMFIGWEGVGLCSYLLISFWYKEKANAVAGMKAFIVNRVGDFGFVLAISLLFWGMAGSYGSTSLHGDVYQGGYYGSAPVSLVEKSQLDRQSRMGFKGPSITPPTSMRFDAIRAHMEQHHELWDENSPSTKTFWGFPLIAVIAILLFVGATGKSAQIPLYVWLPDAMAGPTPVSALIHAATMVTAGVYMVARLNFLFVLTPTGMTVVAGVGAITALLAATIGLFQYDIKKVLAYSTVSQLGYMFIAVGTGAYWVGIYHLITHAIFKALLFLGSGSVILGCHHEQDMRKMGGLKKYMPITHWTYFMGAMAISTAPFFFFANGFFSKDEILWKAFDSQHLLVPGWSLWLMGFIGAGLTSFYMWRSYYMTFTGEYRGGSDEDHSNEHADDHSDDHADAHSDDDHGHGGLPQESPRSMSWVLATLAIMILVTIPLGFWPLLGGILHSEALTVPIFEHWLHPVLGKSYDSITWLSETKNMHTIELILASSSVLLALGGFFFARWMYNNAKNPLPAKLMANPSPWLRIPHDIIFNKYYVDEFYDWAVIRRMDQTSRFLWEFDKRVLDGIVHSAAFMGRLIGALDGLIDTLVVDGMVNGLANGLSAAGMQIRRIQTGRIQSYLAGAALGVLLIVLLNFVFFQTL